MVSFKSKIIKDEMKLNSNFFLLVEKIFNVLCHFISHNQALIIDKYFSSFRNLLCHHVEKFVKQIFYLNSKKPTVLHRHILMHWACSLLHCWGLVRRGREPPGAMSLCYVDTSLPDLPGRPSLHYADQATTMQWTSLHNTEQLFWILVLCVM